MTVWADGSAGGRRAVQWATAEAARRGAALQVLVADAQAELPLPARVLAAVGRVAPGMRFLGHVGEESAAALRESSADSAVVVVPSTMFDLQAVLAEAYCPVVVVPQGSPTTTSRGHRPVVLGAAPWTPEGVFGIAFREAQQRHTPLLAVRLCNDGVLDGGRLLPARLLRWDGADPRPRTELDGALAAWRIICPDVDVKTLVAQERAADFLVALSHEADLVVLGRSARGALLAAVTRSPAAALATRARCPVMVVPAAGPPRWTWLPSRAWGGSG